MQKSYLRQEYWARINRAIDYIDQNLDHELLLADIARIANFSPFHFHRIFHALTGETLSGFIQRIRVEKAATQLLVNPKKSITEIALDCGFAGSASFARAFKERYAMSASQWRDGGFRVHKSKLSKPDSKQGKSNRKPGKASQVSFAYVKDVTTTSLIPSLQRRSVMEKKYFQVSVQDFPDMPVAYVRHIGPYKGDVQLFDKLFNRLFTWAGPRGLLERPELKVLTAYHDNPEITDAAKLRLSVCITVPPDTGVDGDIGLMTLPGGRYACGRFELADDEYQQAWDALFSQWLPDSGYQPDDRPSYEIFRNDPDKHPQHKAIVDICVPVRPM